ncbi:MAG: hypothetical protein IJX88_06635 [Clostridia bacterium]|nr:hypothetical protein [Clostridia bacterium]
MNNQKRKAHITKKLMDNLTYCRLQGDLFAVETAMNENQPLESTFVGKNIFEKLFNSVKNSVENEYRRYTIQELTVKRQSALNALAAYEASHKRNALALSKNIEKLKKYAEKKLFKKDIYGVEKVKFALAFMAEKSYKYQCEEASLEAVSKILFNNPKYMDRLNALYAENYSRIHSKNTVTIVTGFEIGKRVFNSIMHADYRGLVTEAKGIFGIVGAVKNNRLFIKAIDELSFNEICALAAIRLTVLQACGEKMSKESYKEAIDDYLTYVNNVRADAEYKLFAEGMDAPNCKETIETCNACLARLGQIVGI